MELLLLFVFAVLFAILLNWGTPKLQSRFPTAASNFWYSTLLTAVAVAVLLVLVSWVFAEVGEGKVVKVTT
jgi:predicted PurR-regulated permease PerM